MIHLQFSVIYRDSFGFVEFEFVGEFEFIFELFLISIVIIVKVKVTWPFSMNLLRSQAASQVTNQVLKIGLKVFVFH